MKDNVLTSVFRNERQRAYIREGALQLGHGAVHGHNNDIGQAEAGIRRVPRGKLHQQNAKGPDVRCLVVSAQEQHIQQLLRYDHLGPCRLITLTNVQMSAVW